jgi:polyhydroxyalkanoate synthesis regulator phasin
MNLYKQGDIVMFYKQVTREEMIADLVTNPDGDMTIEECVRVVDWLIANKQSKMAEWDRRFISRNILDKVDAEQRTSYTVEGEHDE